MTTPDLFERLRRDDDEAFDTVFREWYTRLVRYAETMLHDRADAEEVVQDVMLGLWRARHSLPPEIALQSYLYRAARNRALNQLRQRKVRERAVPLLVREQRIDPPAESSLAEAGLRRAFVAALAELPPRCREVFQLSRDHGLSYAEIAATLDISVKTVEAQMSKALRLLRERLAHWL